MNKAVRRISAALIAVPLLAGLLSGQSSTPKPPFKDMDSFVAYINAHNRAPFDRNSIRLPQGAMGKIQAAAAKVKTKQLAAVASGAAGTHNVKVNQDHNPWPKAEIGSAVDPVTGGNYVVMTNDFRENWDYQFYHSSTNGGGTWSDDAMVGGFDPVTGGTPLTFQSDPGVAFDSKGHSVLSTITGNSIFDFNGDGYINEDTEIEVAEGFANGTYTSLIPMVVDFQPCNGTFITFTCPIQLDKPLITIDNVPGSPHNGTIYVYYTAFCVQSTPCKDGNATIPAFSSSILEAHAPGAGLPFSAPKLVSGWLTQEQFSSMVIDSHGTPHVFFDDFTLLSGVIRMYESTYNGTAWHITGGPVAKFNFNGTASINWGFRNFGTVAPGCGIYQDTAYCAFSANQIVGGPLESGLSAYVAVVNTLTAASTIHRVNNDPFNDSKDHFFPWATARPDGSVYVGFYDDRNDPFNTNVEYFVAKSTDGGKTFPTQNAVSDVAFNPCVGFPGCGFFGDYTQLVSGPDGVVHAAWSDTRDGASMQVYSQAITW
jgi:hypothetical protein